MIFCMVLTYWQVFWPRHSSVSDLWAPKKSVRLVEKCHISMNPRDVKNIACRLHANKWILDEACRDPIKKWDAGLKISIQIHARLFSLLSRLFVFSTFFSRELLLLSILLIIPVLDEFVPLSVLLNGICVLLNAAPRCVCYRTKSCAQSRTDC